ncbi:MAG: double-stranded DNA-binding protein [Thaumarchaeota archaeon]|nr:double-stranded DNA-binding protein [Nitrososphaeria archaeon]NDB87578.1 double-stranded DNA-binding protein [Nitrososphaerota archaeon]NDB91245.1 double-stranded DNA-binding protein [Nitrososphaeria archaeon]NDF24616.1 double-stranded DNA-binding protein [Nitrososphaerota archaeon]
MSEDRELEALKAKRLAEMRKNIVSQSSKPEQTSQAAPPSYRQIVLSHLGYRGQEVLQNAESQFPNEAKMVIDRLGQLYQTGEVNEQIDGGQLLALFRSVGIHVRMQTKINIEQDGKFVSLSDKLSNTTDENENL